MNLNQIPYDYSVEVTNKVKGLDLIDRVPEELWTKVHHTDQDHHQEKCKKAKWLSEAALQIAEEEEKLKAKKKRKHIPI